MWHIIWSRHPPTSPAHQLQHQLELCGGSSHYRPEQKDLHKVTDPDPTDLNKVTLQTSTRPGKHTHIAIEHGNLQWIFPLKLGGFSIVMLIHQRVDSIFISRIKYPTTLKKNNPSVFQRTRTQVFIIAPSHNQLVVIIVINLHATTIKIHQSVTRYY